MPHAFPGFVNHCFLPKHEMELPGVFILKLSVCSKCQNIPEAALWRETFLEGPAR